MSPLEKYRAFMTIVRKEMRRCLRIWPQTLVPPVITSLLFFLVFGQIIGSRLGQVHDYNYMQYIVPGIIMMQVISSAFMNSSSSFFGSKFSRSVEELLVSPMPNYIIILGCAFGGIFRSILVSILVGALALTFTHLIIHHIAIMIYSLFMTSMLFSLIGLVNGIVATKFDDISWIPAFFIAPLSFLGGVFYPVDALSGIWRQVSLVNPIYYMIADFRYSILGIGQAHLFFSLALLAFLTLLFYILTLWLLKYSKGLRQ